MAQETRPCCERCGDRAPQGEKLCSVCREVIFPPKPEKRSWRKQHRRQPSGPGQVNWSYVKLIMVGLMPSIERAVTEVLGRHNQERKTVVEICVYPPGRHAFVLLECWFSHTDKHGNRALACQGGPPRLLNPTDQELSILGQLIDELMASLPPGFQILRVLDQAKIYSAYSGEPGFVWYKIGPTDLPITPR